MRDSVTIHARFNGPLESGNGGYSAGALASFIDGAVEVTLRSPVPLDTSLRVSREDDGRVLARDGDELASISPCVWLGSGLRFSVQLT